MRDASYVMAHLRPLDEKEVLCQLPAEMKRHEIAHMLINGALEAWAVRWDDQPIGVFGVSFMSVAAISVWALGTKKFWRGVPAVTRFVKEVTVPRMIKLGYRTMEARSIVEHEEAHRWMKATGAVAVDLPYIYGRENAYFRTFRWTADQFARISGQPELLT